MIIPVPWTDAKVAYWSGRLHKHSGGGEEGMGVASESVLSLDPSSALCGNAGSNPYS